MDKIFWWRIKNFYGRIYACTGKLILYNFKGIINLRNEMAYYLSQQIKGVTSEDGHVTYSLGRLPEPINNPRACTKCPQLLNCALYQK